MKRVWWLLVWTGVLAVGCTTQPRAADDVTIEGIVVHEVSGAPLSRHSVELQLFVQESVFRMGAYEPGRRVDTDQEGRFSFRVSKGRSVQLLSRSPGAERIGGLEAINKVREDTSVVLRHDPH